MPQPESTEFRVVAPDPEHERELADWLIRSGNAPELGSGPRREVWRVLIVGGRAAGFGWAALRDGFTGFFVEIGLHVDEPLRGRGAARALLDSLEAWGRHIGCLDFRVVAGPCPPEALGFFDERPASSSPPAPRPGWRPPRRSC